MLEMEEDDKKKYTENYRNLELMKLESILPHILYILWIYIAINHANLCRDEHKVEKTLRC